VVIKMLRFCDVCSLFFTFSLSAYNSHYFIWFDSHASWLKRRALFHTCVFQGFKPAKLLSRVTVQGCPYPCQSANFSNRSTFVHFLWFFVDPSDQLTTCHASLVYFFSYTQGNYSLPKKPAIQYPDTYFQGVPLASLMMYIMIAAVNFSPVWHL